MKRCALLLCLALSCVALPGCRAASRLAPADEAAIRALYQDFSRACVGEKADVSPCVSRYYTEDARIVLPGRPAFQGHDAIAQVWKSLADYRERRVEVDALEGQGGLAYARGTTTFVKDVPGGGSVERTWRWLDIWKRQPDGSWKLGCDFGSQEAQSGLLVAAAGQRTDAEPALLKLGAWLGRWKQEGEYKQTPISPAGPVAYDLDCRWIAAGHQMACSAVGTGASPTYAELIVFGYDREAKVYTAYDADSNGFAGFGRGTLDGTTWRFVWNTSVDGRPAKATWTSIEEPPGIRLARAEISVAGGPAVLVYEGRMTKVD
jgi:ketosteroid isomerase-like protein